MLTNYNDIPKCGNLAGQARAQGIPIRVIWKVTMVKTLELGLRRFVRLIPEDGGAGGSVTREEKCRGSQEYEQFHFLIGILIHHDQLNEMLTRKTMYKLKSNVTSV